MSKSLKQEFLKGFWEENPVLVLLLGMCPTLAVTTNAINGLGMGLATTFVLLGSNIIVSLFRNAVPNQVRIPCYIVIIATFVTLVELICEAYLPTLNKALGIFIPLIVVNCIVLGRAEAFASNNGFVRSAIDALGIGLGFSVTLTLLGATREFLSGGTLFDVQFVPGWDVQFLIAKFAPGAFICLGFFVAGMNYITRQRALKRGEKYVAPKHLDCAHCNLCDLGKAMDTEQE